VSNALEQFGDESVTETARFVGMMDKFFDTLNVHNYHHGFHSIKKFQEPYVKKDEEDFRLKVIFKHEVHVIYNIFNSGWKKTF